jgi:phospholipase C
MQDGRHMPLGVWLTTSVAMVGAAVAPAIGNRAAAQSAAGSTVTVQVTPVLTGIHQIQHVVVIMQENRSFDEYFGMYPGTDGIPVDAGGTPTVCVPDPQTSTCVAPYHDSADIEDGGPHNGPDSRADIDGGKMDGFIANAESQGAPPVQADTVMGYKLRADIPNYWSYADNFVLQDHMYEPVGSWSGPSHLSLVSGWSATCPGGQVQSCTSSIQTDQDGDLAMPNGPKTTLLGDGDDDPPQLSAADYLWTDLSYLLHRQGITWRYYRGPFTPEIWNPLPDFQDVHDNNQLGNVSLVNNLYADASAGTLPAVSWVVPNLDVSDHPPASVSGSQAYVTGVINALMQSPEWSSTAIFLAWDDWGGLYDHVVPPSIDSNGYGLRVPGLVLSPYAKAGYVDHQTLSFDAYLKFIEDDFLGGARLDPATDGRPDPRPDVRENAPVLGDLTSEFDFTQPPRSPLVLQPTPARGVAQRLTAATSPAAGPATGTAPLAVNLTISVSGAMSPTASWSLDFGDGSPPATGTGDPTAPLTHTYARPGSYTATASVTDNNGVTSTGMSAVTVGAAVPAPSLVAYRAVGVAPLPESFDGSLSTDADDPIATWSLDFGDGSPLATGAGGPPSNVTHTYSAVGTFTAALTVTDQDGNSSARGTQIIQTSAAKPPAVFTYPGTVANPQEQLVGAINPNGDRATYHFDYGPTMAYGSSTPTMETNFTNVNDPVSALTANLTPRTTYHYRLVATNSTGTAFGRDLTFVADVGAPTVTTATLSANSTSSVTVAAKVNPEGLETAVQFDYGPTSSYGQHTAARAIGSGQSAVAVTGVLAGLAPKTTYHVRVEATNASGTSFGPDVSFGLFPPAVRTGAAGAVTETSATVGGAINPNLLATTFHVDYGPTAAYGSTTPDNPVGSGPITLAVSAALTGLQPGTTYHYRITAANGLGQVSGADRTFRTSGAPLATTGGVTGVDQATVRALGQVNPDGLATTYWFQYGPTTAYGQTTTSASAGAGAVPAAVQAVMHGIVPRSLYHYRLVAANAVATTYGADAVFRMGPPSATTGSSAGVTSSSAKVGGLVSPGVNQTSFTVQFGLTQSYGSATTPVPVGAGAAQVAVSGSLTGLRPATLYHYRVVATNSFGTGAGGDLTFRTLAGPSALVIAASTNRPGLQWLLPPPAFATFASTRRRRRPNRSRRARR